MIDNMTAVLKIDTLVRDKIRWEKSLNLEENPPEVVFLSLHSGWKHSILHFGMKATSEPTLLDAIFYPDERLS